MSDRAERLKFARTQAGFESAPDAARAMGIKESTYFGHENGSRGFKIDSARRYARFFKVSLEWLLTGRGERELSDIIKLMNELPDEQKDALRSYAEFLRNTKKE